MTEVWDSHEIAGLIVDIVHDDDGHASDPSNNDNAGTIYSWAHDYQGDESIRDPDMVNGLPYDAQDQDLALWFHENYDSALAIPLRFEDYRSNGARIRTTDWDAANCAIVFTQKEIDYEWSGHIEPYPVKRNGETIEYGGARSYAHARIRELDDWFQGNVWGIVVKREDDGDPDAPTYEILESVWGFIGNPASDWMMSEAKAMAEACAEGVAREAAEQFRWECADVVTVP